MFAGGRSCWCGAWADHDCSPHYLEPIAARSTVIPSEARNLGRARRPPQAAVATSATRLESWKEDCQVAFDFANHTGRDDERPLVRCGAPADFAGSAGVGCACRRE